MWSATKMIEWDEMVYFHSWIDNNILNSNKKKKKHIIDDRYFRWLNCETNYSKSQMRWARNECSLYVYLIPPYLIHIYIDEDTSTTNRMGSISPILDATLIRLLCVRNGNSVLKNVCTYLTDYNTMFTRANQ